MCVFSATEVRAEHSCLFILASSEFSSTIWGPTHSIGLVWACRWRGQSPRFHGRQSRFCFQGARQRDHFNLVVVVWPCRWSSPSVGGTLRYTQEQASALQPQNSGQASASASWVVTFLVSCRRSTTVAGENVLPTLCCCGSGKIQHARRCGVKYNVRVGCPDIPDGSLVLYIATVAHVLGLRIVLSETLRRHSACCCGSGNQVHPCSELFRQRQSGYAASGGIWYCMRYLPFSAAEFDRFWALLRLR